jgi:hypothetical protein
VCTSVWVMEWERLFTQHTTERHFVSYLEVEPFVKAMYPSHSDLVSKTKWLKRNICTKTVREKKKKKKKKKAGPAESGYWYMSCSELPFSHGADGHNLRKPVEKSYRSP